MRLEAQIKGGYYPAAPEAVAACLRHLAPPDEGEAVILDPCAGRGAAICQIADAWGCREGTHAIELSEDRARALHEALPESIVVAPANFLGCTMTHACFSFAWVNPPFDDEIGGGQRVEHTFLNRATDLLRPRGVVALVCPEAVAQDYKVKHTLAARYEDWSLIAFPAAVRRYHEVIVLARKRVKLTQDAPYYADYRTEGVPVYQLPPGQRPARFFKCELTDTELRRALAASPLRRLLEPPPELPLPRPPLAPNHGQAMMLLAAGQIDGVIRPPDEAPHLVRGTCRKVEYLHSTEVRESDKGDTTIQTYRQKIEPVVRVLTVDGKITTLTEGD